MTDDDLYWLLTSAAENLRSADKDERRVEAAFRIAFKLDAYCKELAARATAEQSEPVGYVNEKALMTLDEHSSIGLVAKADSYRALPLYRALKSQQDAAIESQRSEDGS